MFEKVYAGDTREEIEQVVAAMDAMRAKLDAPPPKRPGEAGHEVWRRAANKMMA